MGLTRIEPRPAVPAGPYLIAGLRRAGSAAARALLERRPAEGLAAWDAERRTDTSAAAAELESVGVEVVLGGDGLELLRSRPAPRCLVKSPGVPFESKLVAGALERGLNMIDEAELGWRLDSRPVVGVTGTNGKGTSAAAVLTALAAAGLDPILAGNTFFGPPLSEAVGVPGGLVVAELSSFQLAGSPALLPKASLLTNLGQQHWDWHGSREAYVQAKRRMFVRGEQAVPVAAVNGDDAEGRRLARDVERRGGRVVTYGTTDRADYRLLRCDWSLDRSRVRLATPSGERELETRLVGEHNALNLTGAFALVATLGLGAEAVAGTEPLPGRFEPVRAGQPFTLVVDFAHNPDGVAAVLRTARRIVKPPGRLLALTAPLWVHDADMRCATVRTVRALADYAVVTTQRWRAEEPLAPPPDVIDAARAPEGCACTVVNDRAAAIQRIVAEARPGDAVFVLGRGAGPFPLYDSDGEPQPFDDREVAAAAVSRGLRARHGQWSAT